MPAKSNKSYKSEVQYCEWEDEFYLKFPEELINELDWAEGDVLKWEVLDDSTVIISRVEE